MMKETTGKRSKRKTGSLKKKRRFSLLPVGANTMPCIVYISSHISKFPSPLQSLCSQGVLLFIWVRSVVVDHNGRTQFQPKLFSLMTGAEMPCSRTLRPLELWPLLRLPLVPPLPLPWLRPAEEAVTAAEARPIPLLWPFAPDMK